MFQELKEHFYTDKTKPLEWRKEKLELLAKAISENREKVKSLNFSKFRFMKL